MVATTTTAMRTFGWTVCVWVLCSSFQYGFHISVLNQLQDVLTCKVLPPASSVTGSMPPCIPMNNTQFSTVTSSFTLGGLLGSLLAPSILNARGRQPTLRLTALCTLVGTALMAFAPSIFILLLGRTLVGIAAGASICAVPLYISEITPPKLRGSVGVLTQLSIVFGILATQALGLHFASTSPSLLSSWRTVPFISTILSAVQFVLSPYVPESPAWLASHKRDAEARAVEAVIWNTPHRPDDLEDPLLQASGDIPDAAIGVAQGTPAFTIAQLLKSPELRRPVLIMSFAMIGQQFSGINAVLYYSNNILAKTLPDLAAYVSLGITVINVLMTFPPIFLIQRTGHKRLLLASILGAWVSLLGAGYGLNANWKVLSSVAIVAFVASFAAGLGPVPFVIISDIAPFHAVSALSSLALSVNWISNFIVGLVFLPLRDLLSSPSSDPDAGKGARDGEGRVFYVFALVLAVFTILLLRAWR